MRQFEMAQSIWCYIRNTDFQDFNHVAMSWTGKRISFLINLN